jgi:hypothetical protein
MSASKGGQSQPARAAKSRKPKKSVPKGEQSLNQKSENFRKMNKMSSEKAQFLLNLKAVKSSEQIKNAFKFAVSKVDRNSQTVNIHGQIYTSGELMEAREFLIRALNSPIGKATVNKEILDSRQKSHIINMVRKSLKASTIGHTHAENILQKVKEASIPDSVARVAFLKRHSIVPLAGGTCRVDFLSQSDHDAVHKLEQTTEFASGRLKRLEAAVRSDVNDLNPFLDLSVFAEKQTGKKPRKLDEELAQEQVKLSQARTDTKKCLQRCGKQLRQIRNKNANFGEVLKTNRNQIIDRRRTAKRVMAETESECEREDEVRMVYARGVQKREARKRADQKTIDKINRAVKIRHTIEQKSREAARMLMSNSREEGLAEDYIKSLLDQDDGPLLIKSIHDNLQDRANDELKNNKKLGNASFHAINMLEDVTRVLAIVDIPSQDNAAPEVQEELCEDRSIPIPCAFTPSQSMEKIELEYSTDTDSGYCESGLTIQDGPIAAASAIDTDEECEILELPELKIVFGIPFYKDEGGSYQQFHHPSVITLDGRCFIRDSHGTLQEYKEHPDPGPPKQQGGKNQWQNRKGQNPQNQISAEQMAAARNEEKAKKDAEAQKEKEEKEAAKEALLKKEGTLHYEYAKLTDKVWPRGKSRFYDGYHGSSTCVISSNDGDRTLRPLPSQYEWKPAPWDAFNYFLKETSAEIDRLLCKYAPKAMYVANDATELYQTAFDCFFPTAVIPTRIASLEVLPRTAQFYFDTRTRFEQVMKQRFANINELPIAREVTRPPEIRKLDKLLSYTTDLVGRTPSEVVPVHTSFKSVKELGKFVQVGDFIVHTELSHSNEPIPDNDLRKINDLGTDLKALPSPAIIQWKIFQVVKDKTIKLKSIQHEKAKICENKLETIMEPSLRSFETTIQSAGSRWSRITNIGFTDFEVRDFAGGMEMACLHKESVVQSKNRMLQLVRK